MLATDLFLKPASGFIAISPGRADAVAERRSPAPAEPLPETGTVSGTSGTAWAANIGERPTWQAPAGAGVRRVEAAILASVCAFFAFGLASTLGLF